MTIQENQSITADEAIADLELKGMTEHAQVIRNLLKIVEFLGDCLEREGAG